MKVWVIIEKRQSQEFILCIFKNKEDALEYIKTDEESLSVEEWAVL